jgi:hypothetical protein
LAKQFLQKEVVAARDVGVVDEEDVLEELVQIHGFTGFAFTRADVAQGAVNGFGFFFDGDFFVIPNGDALARLGENLFKLLLPRRVARLEISLERRRFKRSQAVYRVCEKKRGYKKKPEDFFGHEDKGKKKSPGAVAKTGVVDGGVCLRFGFKALFFAR